MGSEEGRGPQVEGARVVGVRAGSRDDLGDRMKGYERVEPGRRLDPRQGPIYARLDGRGFSRFARGLRRPFDERLSAAMAATAGALLSETDALVAYAQSDEISLVWSLDGAEPDRQIWFDGKVQKMASVLAAYATAAFTRAVLGSPDPEFRAYAARLPHFDARVLSLPSREEAANALLWRELDATRNAVMMTAQSVSSHRRLQRVGIAGLRDVIAEAGIDFGAYPTAFRRGTWLRRITVERTLSEDERARIPERHRPADGALVTRSEVASVDMPPFASVRNRVEVLFEGAGATTGDPEDA